MYYVKLSNLFCLVKYYSNYVNYQCIRHYTVLNHNVLYIIKIKKLIQIYTVNFKIIKFGLLSFLNTC